MLKSVVFVPRSLDLLASVRARRPDVVHLFWGHYPAIVGYLVGAAQFCGGLAVLTGVLIRIGAGCILVVMLGAVFLVHLPHGFDINKGGIEYAFTQSLIALALLICGAGAYSLAFLLPPAFRKL